MKEKCIQSAVQSMIQSGLRVESDSAIKSIFKIYEKKGWGIRCALPQSFIGN